MIRKYFLQSINICLMVVLMLLLFLGVKSTSILSKKEIIVVALSFIVLITIAVLSYLSKRNKVYNFGVFLTILANILFAFEIYSINNNYDYLKNVTSLKYEYKTYEVYVQKSNTTYSSIEKLNGKTIGLLKNNQNNVKEYLNNLVKIDYKEYNSVDELCEGIKNGDIQAFIIVEDKTNQLKNNKYINKIRVIYSNKIKKNI